MSVPLLTDRVECFVPPRKGVRHVLRIIRELLALKPKGRGTSVGPAIEELNRVLRKRAVVFVLSDFMDEVSIVRFEPPGEDMTSSPW